MIIVRTYLKGNVKYVDYGIDSDKSVELNEWVLTD